MPGFWFPPWKLVSSGAKWGLSMVEKSEGPEAGGHCPESHKKIAANGRIFVIAQPRNQRQRRTESCVSTLFGVSAFAFAAISNLCAFLGPSCHTPLQPRICPTFRPSAWASQAKRATGSTVRLVLCSCLFDPIAIWWLRGGDFRIKRRGVGAPKLALGGGFLDPAYQKYGFISSAGHWAQ